MQHSGDFDSNVSDVDLEYSPINLRMLFLI